MRNIPNLNKWEHHRRTILIQMLMIYKQEPVTNMIWILLTLRNQNLMLMNKHHKIRRNNSQL